MSIIKQSFAHFLCISIIALGGCNQQLPPQQTSAENSETAEASNSEPQPENAVVDTSDTPEMSKKLDIGDTAPNLRIADWVKGDPISTYQDNRIYVVEFWATWCGPCRAGMPHISELQEKHESNVTFVGITDEQRSIVDNFLEKKADSRTAESEGQTWDDLMRYTVAIDAEDATSTAFMKAAGENGIPTAFIVGYDGHIEWIGHPAGIDQPLQQVVDRSWNREAARTKRVELRRLAELRQRIFQDIDQATSDKNWDQALQLAEELEKTIPDVPLKKITRFGILLKADRIEQAKEVLDELVTNSEQNPNPLNAFAWQIATTTADKSLLQAGVEIAEQASELTNDKDANILDTVARLHYELGDLDKAIEWQKRAVDANPSSEQIRQTLEKYSTEAEPPKAKEPVAETTDDNKP